MIYSRPVLIVLLLILAWVLYGTWGIFQKERGSRANLVRVQNQLATLEARNRELSVDVARLSTEQGKEEEIRSKYEVSKPGEQLLVIVDKSTTATTSPRQSGFGRLWSNFTSIFKRN